MQKIKLREMNLIISFVDRLIDGCVYELFFPNEFKKKKLEST